MPRYEFSEGSSNKFWDINLTDKSFTTTYGKIGSNGQTTIKTFKSSDEAKREYEKLIAEKVKKGYKLVGGKGGKPNGEAKPEKAGKAGKAAAAPAETGKRDARNPDLEAAIAANPTDREAYAVFADWLQEQGDPRGELIATQLAAEQTGDPELRRAALRVFARHREQFLGELGSLISADAFTWRAGFIRSAALAHDRLLIEGGTRVASSLAEVITRLFAHESARYLVELVVRSNDRGMWDSPIGSQREIVDAIAAARPRVLRRLQLGDAGYGISRIGKLEHAWPALANLHELVLEGEVALGRLVLPELRVFALRPRPLRRKLGRELVEAAWPNLRSLRITFTDYPDHIAREITALVHRDDMPALAHLALVGYSAADEVLDALSRSPLLAHLQTLDLSHGQLTDRGLRPVLAAPEAFAHLASFDISGTQVSRTAFGRLAARVPNAVGSSLTRGPA